MENKVRYGLIYLKNFNSKKQVYKASRDNEFAKVK